MKTIINSLLVGGIVTGNLTFSREELDAEAVVVDEQLDAAVAAPAVVDAVEAVETTEAELDVSEDTIEEASEAAENLGEAQQSLENLIELLSMEAADLTKREYGMIMATANGYLSKARIDDSVMSFEEASEVAVPREEAKATLGEKAKALAKAGKDAIMKMIAAIGKWMAGMFDHVTRLRNQLVSMGKSVSEKEFHDTNVELDPKYSKVMTGRVFAGLSKAADKIFGEHTESLAELQAEVAKLPLEELTTASLKTRFREIQLDASLPGNPRFGDAEHPAFSMAGDSYYGPNFTFHYDDITGDKPVKLTVTTRGVRTEIAEMIRICDSITAAKKGWDKIVADNKRLYADEKFIQRIVSRLGVNGVTGFYDLGPRRFMKYAVQVLSLRASGYAKAIKEARSGATDAAGAVATA